MLLSDSQKWLVLAAIILFGWLFYLLSPILMPFFVGALLAYLGDPSADLLERWGASRVMAVVMVFLMMTVTFVVLVLVLLPVVQGQVGLLMDALPGYLAWGNATMAPWFEENFGYSAEQFDLSALSGWLTENWSQAGGVAAGIAATLSRSGGFLLTWVANLLLIPVVTFYLLRDWDHLVAYIDHLLPRSIRLEVAHVTAEADSMLGAFLRGQIMVMLCLGTIYSVGLWLVGVKFALLIGMLAGLVSFVPYLGFVVGLLVAGIAVLLQTHDVMQLLPVLGVFAVGQAAEGMLLTPLLVGDRIGLHPVVVIFSVLAGGQLFGFVGILLALPVAAVIAVVVRDLHRRYMDSQIYQQEAPGKIQTPQ